MSKTSDIKKFLSLSTTLPAGSAGSSPFGSLLGMLRGHKHDHNHDHGHSHDHSHNHDHGGGCCGCGHSHDDEDEA